MKYRLIISTLALGLMLNSANVAAQDSLAAGKTTQPEKTSAKAKRVVKVNGVTVYERPITNEEKETAKQMVKQTGKMVGKAAQMAATAISNPTAAKQMGKEIEQMGEELDEMGEELRRMDDSLGRLMDDTTFISESEDSDEVLVGDEYGFDDNDLDDIIDGWTSGDRGLWNWVKGLFGGGLGLLGGIFGGLVMAVVTLFLFALFTAPLWIVFLLLFLVIRSGRKRDADRMAHTYNKSAATAGTTNQARTTAGSAQPNQHSAYTRTASAPRQQQSFQMTDENEETWKSGVRQSAIGAGMFICFFILKWKILLVFSVVLVCLGVAKLVIATTTKGRKQYHSSSPQQESFVTGLGNQQDYAQAQASGEAPTDAEIVEQEPDSADTYNKTEGS